MRWSRAGLRTKVGLALEAGDCRDVHHAAVLIGYGAGAVCPWLALQTARTLAGEAGEASLLKALEAGLAKVMSKMGISVLDSYRAAQLFDISGSMTRWWTGVSPAVLAAWEAWDLPTSKLRSALRGLRRSTTSELPDYGWVRFRRDERAEPHTWQPQRTRHLQLAVGAARRRCRAPRTRLPTLQAWSAYAGAGEEREPAVLRDLLDFRPAGPAFVGL